MMFTHGTNHSKGVLILISDDLQINIKSVQVDNNVNLYAPTKTCEQILFFDQVANILDPNCQIIIGGDFNTHLDPILDNLGRTIESKPSAKKIREILTANDLTDIWRTRNPEKKQFTWTQKKPDACQH